MAILNILEYPHPRLRIKAEPVSVVDDSIGTLVDDMFETMADAQGIGLAATQVDVHQRVIVMDISEQPDHPKVYINPEIEVMEPGTLPYDEGCLSVPGFYETVDRPAHVIIRALDRDGNAFKEEAKGLLAVCIQHEIDHLEGKLFVDYLSPIKRERIRKKLKKQRA
jgi:peptide deformylase